MAFLQTRNGFDAGRIYELKTGPHLLGRHPDCAVIIEQRSVSRYHAEIVVRSDEVTIEDRGSRNGTLVNRQKIEGKHPLQDGDEVRICDVVFGFTMDRPDDLPFVGPTSTTISPARRSTEGRPTMLWQDASREEFQPTISPDNLRKRAELLGKLRNFFHRLQYLEVETPLLSNDTVVDRYIEPVPVILGEQRRWLQTSPEFAMKRLLTSGLPAIYQVTRAFREAERGRLHNPEFTIVEWYRCDENMEQAMWTLSDLSQDLLGTPAADIVSYSDMFKEHLDFDPVTGKDTDLIQVIASLEVSAPDNWRTMDRDGWLNLLLSEVVQPKLGLEKPVIMHSYPASQAALAALDPADERVAQRFELFYKGVELANGYHELRDAKELRARNIRVNAQRKKDGTTSLPQDSFLLAAMDHGLPECSGTALGFDRLVMLACGAQHIDEVLAFPIERA